MTGRDRVWEALLRRTLSHPPKGEILIENGWLRSAGFQDLSEVIQYLKADLVVLPVMPPPQHGTGWQEWSRSRIFLFGRLQGPVTYFTGQYGWHDFSRLLIKDPLTARKIIADFMAQSVEAALPALDQGCEGIIVFDDLAGDKGLLINPKFLAEQYFPVMKQALEQIDCKHIPVIFHSDGYIFDLIPLLKAAGFWGIQGLQPSLHPGPDVFAGMKDWVYWGNFDFEGQWRLKNTGEVESDVQKLLTEWQDFPGFIFGSSGGIYQGLSLPEIAAAYSVVENWNR